MPQIGHYCCEPRTPENDQRRIVQQGLYRSVWCGALAELLNYRATLAGGQVSSIGPPHEIGASLEISRINLYTRIVDERPTVTVVLLSPPLQAVQHADTIHRTSGFWIGFTAYGFHVFVKHVITTSLFYHDPLGCLHLWTPLVVALIVPVAGKLDQYIHDMSGKTSDVAFRAHSSP
jgi:hypothetical protein